MPKGSGCVQFHGKQSPDPVGIMPTALEFGLAKRDLLGRSLQQLHRPTKFVVSSDHVGKSIRSSGARMAKCEQSGKALVDLT
jgi:hypothetical protein